jgi:glutathione S-transferase
MPEESGGLFRWMSSARGTLEYAIVSRSMGWDVAPDKRGRVGFGSFEDTVAALVGHLSTRTYFCDERFTAVDVFVGAQVSWGLRFGTLPEEPALAAYRDRLRDRPRPCARPRSTTGSWRNGRPPMAELLTEESGRRSCPRWARPDGARSPRRIRSARSGSSGASRRPGPS